MIKRIQAGMTLLELMLALTIGLIIIGAAAQVMIRHSQEFARSEALALMQEQAATALRLLTRDLEMSGFWGLASRAEIISGRSIGSNTNPNALKTPTRCTPEFVLSIAFPINPTADPQSWACGLTHAAGNDGIVIRHASADLATPQFNRLQIAAVPGQALLLDNGSTPPATALDWQHRDLQVKAYYVAPNSTLFPDQPVLKRLTLNALTTGPVLVDEEVTAGIEKLKLTFAVDTDADGYADSWVAAGDPSLTQTQTDGTPLVNTHAVEVGLIMRSDKPRWRTDTVLPIAIGGEQWIPPNDGFLRLSLVKTIILRNPPATL